jgi:hypothetical protein
LRVSFAHAEDPDPSIGCTIAARALFPLSLSLLSSVMSVRGVCVHEAGWHPHRTWTRASSLPHSSAQLDSTRMSIFPAPRSLCGSSAFTLTTSLFFIPSQLSSLGSAERTQRQQQSRPSRVPGQSSKKRAGIKRRWRTQQREATAAAAESAAGPVLGKCGAVSPSSCTRLLSTHARSLSRAGARASRREEGP